MLFPPAVGPDSAERRPSASRSIRLLAHLTLLDDINRIPCGSEPLRERNDEKMSAATDNPGQPGVIVNEFRCPNNVVENHIDSTPWQMLLEERSHSTPGLHGVPKTHRAYELVQYARLDHIQLSIEAVHGRFDESFVHPLRMVGATHAGYSVQGVCGNELGPARGWTKRHEHPGSSLGRPNSSTNSPPNPSTSSGLVDRLVQLNYPDRTIRRRMGFKAARPGWPHRPRLLPVVGRSGRDGLTSTPYRAKCAHPGASIAILEFSVRRHAG